MKCSFGISDFLEEISGLSHSVVFLYFFALIADPRPGPLFEARKQSSWSGKESAQGCIPKRLLGRPDYLGDE